MTFRQSLEAIRSHQRRGATTPERAITFLVARYGISEAFARYKIDAFCRGTRPERERIGQRLHEQTEAYLSRLSAPITWTTAPTRATITTSSGDLFQATYDARPLRDHYLNQLGES